MGVPVVVTKIALFMGVGFCAWLLGMHNLFNYNNVQSGQGVGNEFIYIIAAVIGGCLLTGGYGSVVGATIGALIFGMTQLGITYAGWNPTGSRPSSGHAHRLATLVNLYVKRKADAPMSAMEKTTVGTTDATGAPVLELENVGKSYGNVHALRGVNISVRQGEVTCVLGDNGAGKSTLIKIIAGLHDYTEGTMKLNGDVARVQLPPRRPVARHRDRLPGPRARPADGRVAQLLPRERDPQGPLPRHPGTMKRICGEELTKMGIVIPDLDRPVGSLSGGQRQSSPSPGRSTSARR